MIRRPRGSASTAHLDQAVLTRLLSGDELADRKDAIDHLSECASCRSRLEAADPLARLVAGETPVPAGVRRPVPLPPGSAWRVPRPPRRQWVAGAAAAAALALVAVGVSERPSAPASSPSRIAQLTQVIEAAARQHDARALERALQEVRAELSTLGSARVVDAQLRADLHALRAEVDALPPDADTAVIEHDVQTALDEPGDTGGQTEEAQTSGTPAPGAGETESTPTPGEVQPAPTSQAEPTSTPAPAPADATPAPSPDGTTSGTAPSGDVLATPSPDADASPTPQP